MDYAPASCGERTSAGTKHQCIYCKRPTYRTIMSKYVCSYCTGRAGKLAREWNDRHTGTGDFLHGMLKIYVYLGHG